MALFRALQGIAPHLDAAMVLNVCEGAGLIVSVRDHSGQILHASDAAVAQLVNGHADGESSDFAELRYFSETGVPLERDELPHEQVRRTGEDQLHAVFRIAGPRGSIWLQMSFIALARGETGYSVLGIGSDVTDQREASSLLERMATHDGLTSLLNRAGLRAQAEPRLEAAAAAAAPFAAIMVDLDRFKVVNDSHGHAAGDALLAAVAHAIRDVLPATALCARWGGEEFLIVLPDTAPDVALGLAERVRGAIAAVRIPLAEVDGTPAGSDDVLRITASAGVASLGGPYDTLEAVIGQADEGLYAAKRGGRDQVAA